MLKPGIRSENTIGPKANWIAIKTKEKVADVWMKN